MTCFKLTAILPNGNIKEIGITTDQKDVDSFLQEKSKQHSSCIFVTECITVNTSNNRESAIFSLP